MGRIGRRFNLVAQSYRILMQDKELMVLPLISGAIMAAAGGSFALGFGLTTTPSSPSSVSSSFSRRSRASTSRRCIAMRPMGWSLRDWTRRCSITRSSRRRTDQGLRCE